MTFPPRGNFFFAGGGFALCDLGIFDNRDLLDWKSEGWGGGFLSIEFSLMLGFLDEAPLDDLLRRVKRFEIVLRILVDF